MIRVSILSLPTVGQMFLPSFADQASEPLDFVQPTSSQLVDQCAYLTLVAALEVTLIWEHPKFNLSFDTRSRHQSPEDQDNSQFDTPVNQLGCQFVVAYIGQSTEVNAIGRKQIG